MNCRALALIWLALAPGLACADAGASGRWPDLAQALLAREAGDLAGAAALVDSALAAADSPAAQWEARLAQAETGFEAGEVESARDQAQALLTEGTQLFGAEAARLSGPLVLLGASASALEQDDVARGHLLRAVRLARAGHAGAMAPDGRITDRQALADLLAALAALGEHLLTAATPEPEAAALLGAELAVLGADAPPGLPPRWQEGALIAALAQMDAGRPADAFGHAAPVLRLDAPGGTLRAGWLIDQLDLAFADAAEPLGDPETVIGGWIAEGSRREADLAAAQNRQAQQMAPMMAALAQGDAVAADAAGRIALAQVQRDDPLVVTSYLALLGATATAGRADLALAWALRLAEMPASYMASLAVDPGERIGQLAADLTSAGDHRPAIALAEASALLASLRETGAPGLPSFRALVRLAAAYTDAGRRAQAGEAYDRALALVPPDPVPPAWVAQTIAARAGRAVLRQDGGDLAGAGADLAAALDLLRGSAERHRPEAWVFLAGLLRDLHLAAGAPDRAEAALREALAQVIPLAGAQSAPAAQLWLDLARLRQGKAATEAAGRALQAASPLPPGDPLRLRVVLLADALGLPGADAAAEITAGGTPATLALAEAAAAASADGQGDAALAYLDRAITALETEAPPRAYLQAARAQLLHARGADAAALPAYRAATAALTQADRRQEPAARDHLPGHVTLALAAADAAQGAEAANRFTEAFQVAQRVNDLAAGAALGRATARLLGRAPGAADLARQLEGAERGLATARDAYLTALARPGDTGPARNAMLAARRDLARVETDVAARFPEYAALADPRPVDLLATMRLLAPDEALLLYATAPGDQGHVFAITRDGYMATPLPPRDALVQLARDLRCAAALTDRRCGAGASGTRGAFSLTEDEEEPAGPGFDLALAHRAWTDLLAPVAPALQGKRAVIIVPDRALAALPFHLTLTEAPGPGSDLRAAPWLIRRMAVTILPSVASLAALRHATSRPSAADRPFFGMGDPLIGAQADGALPYDCGTPPETALLATALLPGSQPILRDGGQADRLALAALPALPDTRCELERNASRLGAAPGSVLLQGDATETRLKDLSARGELARYRLLAFATHGLIAGEVGAADAGLVLTPPALPDAQDDGLLTTAEIAGLRLDADFVLLSACNTAAGSSEADEGFAGLASAFFLAGARSLLVSHWPVYSDAATALTTGLVQAMAAPDAPDRAEALRRAMLAILDDPATPSHALHPGWWGPFALVGDAG